MPRDQTDIPLPHNRKFLLPAWLWLGAPLLLFCFTLGLLIYAPELFRQTMEQEGGVIEMGTPAVLVPAIAAGILCYRNRKILPAHWLTPWFLMVTAACVYIAGEELSWGQQFFHWATPESLQDINDQNETNIHNISSWFDQKPRILLAVWVMIGGVILPLWRKWKGIIYNDRDWRYWFWPDIVCLPTALLAFPGQDT
jgi:hypothetical protein